jgi:hypothetical protein
MEGMAAWGLISSARLEHCDARGTARVVAVTKDGRTLATRCMEEGAARRVYALVRLYISNWSKLIIEDYKPGR